MKEAIWIVGRGLLGSSLESRIRTDYPDAHLFVPPRFSWNDPAKLELEFTTAVTSFREIAKTCDRYRLFWTAGRGIMSSTDDDMAQETANLARFLRILDADPELKTIAGVLGFSSSAGGVYAGSTDDTITEMTPVAPTMAYGRGKLQQEELLKASVSVTRGVLIARIANLYGPGQSRTKKQGLLTHIARCMLTHTPIHIFVPFDTMRDYLHASDGAADFLNASACVKSGEIVIKIIASEEPATIAAIVGLFKRITRRTPLLVTGSNALGAAYPHRMRFSSGVLQHTRAANRISLPEGIAETFACERMQYAAEGMRA
ncbi:MAG: NAD-dependent epimerase/dehydratase family protein [Candidatus Peribacteraceae bacterium]|nr:NAD-dependent epimerase/dehydratase family protein [Candidatus Peribacteraceae bacterium]